ncbi:MAG: hypothetical protein JW780_08210 [Clostridiales bacterium]|nr:hypothetical protein [Clostridiales bacterium]
MSDQYNTPVLNTTVSVGEWIVTYILMAIPLVNFIMLIVWAFGSDAAPSKKNWAKAMLILMVIGIVLTIIIYAIIFATMGASGIFDSYY